MGGKKTFVLYLFQNAALNYFLTVLKCNKIDVRFSEQDTHKPQLPFISNNPAILFKVEGFSCISHIALEIIHFGLFVCLIVLDL